MMNDIMTDPAAEVVCYWRQIVGTLNQRRLLRERPQQGGVVLPMADPFLLPDRVLFVLDMQRLGGISREEWLNPALWRQFRAALEGRRVIVADGGGLAICVARVPGVQQKRLPAVIPLELDALPDGPYTVTLGRTRRGPVALDLAGDHRAILTGGASGSGKTNFLQSIVLQLAAKHPPEEVRFAIVDTKEVDFGLDYAGLPHLFAPIAHTLEEARVLIERVEGERQRRQALQARLGVAFWRQLPPGEQMPLLLLLVDEAADFAGSPTMATLVEIARKGRSFGISIVLGTQSPSARVIDPQVRANLPTAIAFQTRTHIESQVILGRSGAEGLNRPGLALAFLDGRWDTIQTLRVAPDLVRKVVGQAAAPGQPLTPLQVELVQHAVGRLGGAFIVNALYEAFHGRISKRALTDLAQRWEGRGWLTAPAHATDPRRVTEELLLLLVPPLPSAAETVTG